MTKGEKNPDWNNQQLCFLSSLLIRSVESRNFEVEFLIRNMNIPIKTFDSSKICDMKHIICESRKCDYQRSV